MTERRWEAYGSVAGVIFAVSLALSIFIVPSPPHIDASTNAVVTFVAGHHAQLLWGCAISAVGALAAVVFISHLRHVLDRVEHGGEGLSPLMYGAGIAAAAIGTLAIVPQWVLVQLIDRGSSGDTGAVRTTYSLLQGTNNATLLLAGLFIGTAGYAMARGAIGEPWLGWLGLAVGAVTVVGTVGGLSSTSYLRWVVVLDIVSVVGFIVWTLATSVVMLLRPETDRALSRRPVIATSH